MPLGKVDKLTGEEILPLDQSRVIEQAKFTYSLMKSFGKTSNNNWRSREITSWSFKSFNTSRTSTKTELIKGIFPKDLENSEIKD